MQNQINLHTIQRLYSFSDYNFLDETIKLYYESTYNKFNSNEKFILTHLNILDKIDVIEPLKDDFLNFVTNYNTKRIDDSYERRIFLD